MLNERFKYEIATVEKKFSSLVFLLLIFFGFTKAVASPNALTYQGRIVKADGAGLEYNNVSFVFQLTDPTGQCVIYQEQVNGVNMSNSGGVFDIPIGLGTIQYPLSGTATVLDAFNNSSSFTCGSCSSSSGTYSCASGSSTYTAVVDDVRKLRVSFYDGTGWKLITPDNTIRTVPFAAYSMSAQKLGTNIASDFLLKAGLPTCGAGAFLTWNGTALSCGSVSGASGGTVTDVTSTNSYLSVATGTSTPALTLNVGTAAGTVAAGNDSRITGAMQSGASAGGALTGTYPNPGLSNNSVTSAAITDASVTTQKIFTNPGVNRLVGTDSSTGSTLTAVSCGANQLLTWSVALGWQCTNQSSLVAGSAALATNFSGSLTGDVTGTQGATIVSKIGGYTLDLSAAPTSNQVLTWDGTKWLAASLPAGNAGTVTSVSSANSDIAVATGTNTPVLTLNSGTSAHQILKLDAAAKIPAVDGSQITNLQAAQIPNLDAAKITTGTLTNNISAAQGAFTSLKIYDGTTNYLTQSSANGGFANNYTVRWPSDKGTAGQVLQISGVTGAVADLSWATPSAGSVTSVSAAATAGNPITIGGTASAPTVDIPVATGSSNGYLSSADWTTFNNKQASGNYITALTGDVTAAGPGSASATIANNAVTTAKINDGAVTTVKALTANPGINRMVATDGTTGATLSKMECSTVGEVLSWTVATGFQCNAISALYTAPVTSVAGKTGAVTLASADITDATNANTASMLVKRDASGNFSAGIMTGTGVVTGTLQVTGGSPVAGKVLTSDASGNGTWQAFNASQWTTSGSNIYYNTGNVGIGTASPGANLDITYTPATTSQYGLQINASGGGSATGNATAHFIADTSNSDISQGRSGLAAPLGGSLILRNNSNNGIVFQTNGSNTRAIIDNAGNVGIGTTSPSTSLEVRTGSILLSSAATTGSLGFKSEDQAAAFPNSANERWLNFMATGTVDGSLGYKWSWRNSDGSPRMDAMTMHKSGQVHFTGGNVGIGTTSPSANLSVKGSGTGIVDIGGWVGNATYGAIYLNGSATTTNSYNILSGPGDPHLYINRPSTYDIRFRENNGADQVTIKSGGNVGIGTSSPTSTLHLSTSTTSTDIQLESFGVGASSIFRTRTARGTRAAPTATQLDDSIGAFAAKGYGATGWSATHSVGVFAKAGENFTDAAAGGYLTFETTANGGLTRSERMRISPYGNVGIGTTAPGISTSAGRVYLTLKGPTEAGILEFATAQADADANRVGLVQWTDVNSTSAEKRVGAMGVILDGTTANARGGALTFYIKPDNGVSMNEGMRISQNGNIGIGTTTPSYKLDVQGGDINASGSVRAAGVALSSDIRFKQDIKVLDRALEKILRIRGVSYQWRTEEFPERHFNNRSQIGVIAQEVESEFPELVDTDKSGYKSVNYPALVSPLIESTKEIYGMCKENEKKVDAVARDLASLKSENADKDKEIAVLKDKVDKTEKENAEIKARLERLEKVLLSK